MSLIFIIEKHKITSTLVLWRCNQMTVEQVCAQKNPHRCHDNEQARGCKDSCMWWETCRLVNKSW